MLCRRTILPSLLLVALSAHPLPAHPMIETAGHEVDPAVPREIPHPLTPWRVTGGRLALGVSCSETSGSANNGDRFWLGPRSGWNRIVLGPAIQRWGQKRTLVGLSNVMNLSVR